MEESAHRRYAGAPGGWAGLLAQRGHVLLCDGRGGVMQAACRGAHDDGCMAVGILPCDEEEANSYLDIAIATGMGQARNAIIVKSADAVIALPGEMEPCRRWLWP